MGFWQKKRIFLDYAAGASNPSAIHAEGVQAKKKLRAAREEVAKLLHAHPEEIVFTSSGTESDNLAIFGVGGDMVTTNIEHPAILEPCKEIERRASLRSGKAVTYVAVGEDGIVSASEIEKVITKDTKLVTLSCANSEIGTIQPIREIAKVVKKWREENNTPYPYLHVDATAAANYLPVQVDHLNADLVTLDGNKIYGPAGVGMLYVRRGVKIKPIIFGGGQEEGLRSGTQNVEAIAEFAEALKKTIGMREKESERLTKLRDFFLSELENLAVKPPSSLGGWTPKLAINGSIKEGERLPNNINICIPGIDAEFAVIKLDAMGIAASSGSSCRNLKEGSSSHVIEALGKPDCANSSIRISMGRGTTKKDLNRALKQLRHLI